MALVLDTSRLPISGQHIPGYDKEQQDWIYNNMDCCLTTEILDTIKTQLQSPEQQGVYDFERALLPMALEMMDRGILVDDTERQTALGDLDKGLERLKHLGRKFSGVWGDPINIASFQQLSTLLYEKMGAPPQYKIEKGERKLTTNRDALESLRAYFKCQPICNTTLKYRDTKKLHEGFSTGIDEDGCMRYSANVGATETGRWSFSKSPLGGGTSMQNITERLRRVFIPRPGFKFAYPDLKQAESYVVGYRSGDQNYIDALESGDLHTFCAQLIWPKLPWIKPWNKHLAENRAIAEQKFYRHFSYRDMSKRGGHLTNYRGTAKTMAEKLHLPLSIANEFQNIYLSTFDRIPQWQEDVRQTIQLDGYLTTCLGRTRHFFGRLDAEETWREAVAYEPQSVVGDILSIGILRLWLLRIVHIILQVHDSALMEYEIEKEAEVLPRVQEAMTVSVPINGRTMTIPVEMTIGMNWSKRDPENKLFEDGNPNGLVEWVC